MSSYGRRKRDLSEDESVLAKTRLSKSVAVQAEDFEGKKLLQTENYASPVTAPTPIGNLYIFMNSIIYI